MTDTDEKVLDWDAVPWPWSCLVLRCLVDLSDPGAALREGERARDMVRAEILRRQIEAAPNHPEPPGPVPRQRRAVETDEATRHRNGLAPL